VHSCRTDPIKRPAYPFCQGERNEVSWSQVKRTTKCSVIVTDEIFGRRVPRECFGDLARQPLRRWVLGHRKSQQLSPSMAKNEIRAFAGDRPRRRARVHVSGSPSNGHVIDNLVRAIRKLAAAGVEHCVLTADHGHLFFTSDRDESMRIDAPGGNEVDQTAFGRFAMSTPVPVRSDFDAAQLHKLGKGSRDPDRPDSYFSFASFTAASKIRI
jgi:hypothetical protein